MMPKVYILLFIILIGCQSKRIDFDNSEQFQLYLSDPKNGFINKNESTDLVFEAKLIPPTDGKDTRCKIHLKVSRKDGGSVLEHGSVSTEEALEREGILSFELQNDVYLKIGTKEYSPNFHHYERNFGLKPSIDVFFDFSIKPPKEDVVFIYRDQLFGQGLVQINFNKELFNRCYVKSK